MDVPDDNVYSSRTCPGDTTSYLLAEHKCVPGKSAERMLHTLDPLNIENVAKICIFSVLKLLLAFFLISSSKCVLDLPCVDKRLLLVLFVNRMSLRST